MTSAAMGAEQASPGRRFTVSARQDAADVSRARTRTGGRASAPHLRAVPNPVAAPARPVRGGTIGPDILAGQPSRTARAKAAKVKSPRRVRAAVRISPGEILRIVYTDTVDGWIVQGRTLSIREVATARYAVPGDYPPFRVWCTVYTRTVGVVVAAVLDGAKFVFIHPVRGPVAAVGITAGIIAPHFIH